MSNNLATNGIYEQLITSILEKELSKNNTEYEIHKEKIDPSDAALYLSRYLIQIFNMALESFPVSDEHRVRKQIEL